MALLVEADGRLSGCFGRQKSASEARGGGEEKGSPEVPLQGFEPQDYEGGNRCRYKFTDEELDIVEQGLPPRHPHLPHQCIYTSMI